MATLWQTSQWERPLSPLVQARRATRDNSGLTLLSKLSHQIPQYPQDSRPQDTFEELIADAGVNERAVQWAQEQPSTFVRESSSSKLAVNDRPPSPTRTHYTVQYIGSCRGELGVLLKKQALQERPVTAPTVTVSADFPPWRRKQHAAAQRHTKLAQQAQQQQQQQGGGLPPAGSHPSTSSSPDRPSSRGASEAKARVYPGTRPDQPPALAPNDLRRVVDDAAGVQRLVHSVFAPNGLPRTPGAVRPGSQRGPRLVELPELEAPLSPGAPPMPGIMPRLLSAGGFPGWKLSRGSQPHVWGPQDALAAHWRAAASPSPPLSPTCPASPSAYQPRSRSHSPAPPPPGHGGEQGSSMGAYGGLGHLQDSGHISHPPLLKSPGLPLVPTPPLNGAMLMGSWPSGSSRTSGVSHAPLVLHGPADARSADGEAGLRPSTQQGARQRLSAVPLASPLNVQSEGHGEGGMAPSSGRHPSADGAAPRPSFGAVPEGMEIEVQLAVVTQASIRRHRSMKASLSQNGGEGLHEAASAAPAAAAAGEDSSDAGMQGVGVREVSQANQEGLIPQGNGAQEEQEGSPRTEKNPTRGEEEEEEEGGGYEQDFEAEGHESSANPADGHEEGGEVGLGQEPQAARDEGAGGHRAKVIEDGEAADEEEVGAADAVQPGDPLPALEAEVGAGSEAAEGLVHDEEPPASARSMLRRASSSLASSEGEHDPA